MVGWTNHVWSNFIPRIAFNSKVNQVQVYMEIFKNYVLNRALGPSKAKNSLLPVNAACIQ